MRCRQPESCASHNSSYALHQPGGRSVSAFLDHKDKQTIDPMDVSLWRFFVVPTSGLDKYDQDSISLAELLKHFGEPVEFREIRAQAETAKSPGQHFIRADQ